MAARASIKDVAATAGVSFQTASRVLLSKGNVSVATRARILEAAEALKYVPNALARYVVSCRADRDAGSFRSERLSGNAGSRPTIREVAATARVSIKSVSRVINGEPGVSESLISRVNGAAAELQYRYNIHASSLRRSDGKSQTIATLMRDATTSFSACLLRVIQDEALERGVLVFAGSSDEDVERERELMAAFTSHRIDGLIVVAGAQDDDLLVSERRAGTAMVFIDMISPVLESDVVFSDKAEGVRVGVRHLIAHRHKRIAYLGGQSPNRIATRFYQAYTDELTARGLRADEQLVRNDISNVWAAKAAALELLSLPDCPTAIFTSDVSTTTGAHQAIHSLDLRHQVALVGFDDDLLADFVGAGVTVVARDPGETGRIAASLLFRRIDGDCSPPVNQAVPLQLISRGSGEILIGRQSLRGD